jgi:hypothetical protein
MHNFWIFLPKKARYDASCNCNGEARAGQMQFGVLRFKCKCTYGDITPVCARWAILRQCTGLCLLVDINHQVNHKNVYLDTLAVSFKKYSFSCYSDRGRGSFIYKATVTVTVTFVGFCF